MKALMSDIVESMEQRKVGGVVAACGAQHR